MVPIGDRKFVASSARSCAKIGRAADNIHAMQSKNLTLIKNTSCALDQKFVEQTRSLFHEFYWIISEAKPDTRTDLQAMSRLMGRLRQTKIFFYHCKNSVLSISANHCITGIEA